jgi:hypothetical protein
MQGSGYLPEGVSGCRSHRSYLCSQRSPGPFHLGAQLPSRTDTDKEKNMDPASSRSSSFGKACFRCAPTDKRTEARRLSMNAH